MQIVLFPELFEKISFKNMGQVITSIKGNFTHVNMLMWQEYQPYLALKESVVCTKLLGCGIILL